MDSKKDLQAELESLRGQVESHGSTDGVVTYVRNSDNPNAGPGPAPSQFVPSPSSVTIASIPIEAKAIDESVAKRPTLGRPFLTASHMPTLSRALNGLEIGSQTIDACFEL